MSEPAEPDPAPALPPERPELAEEVRLGGNPAGRAVNAALLALSRTARSFLLYDPRNEAIRGFIEDLKTKIADAGRAAGAIALEVRPFELVLGGEVVYLERDRERSLAFRLFRDGVRRLSIDPGVEWEEVLRLLEILSIRYTGIRQNEDDIVTLLRKAGFAHIAFDAVEGFVPEVEDGGEAPAAVVTHAGGRAVVPADWDLPLRALGAPAALVYRPVAAADRERLCAEEAPAALPAQAVRAAIEMIWAAADPTDPTSLDDVAPFVTEVRDFLLAESALANVITLVRELKDSTLLEPTQVQPLLLALADKLTVGRMVRAVPASEIGVPQELVELLELLPADHLALLIDLLGEADGDAERRHLRILIERYAAGNAEPFFARMHTAPPRIVRDLLRVCTRALPDRAVQAAIDMAFHTDVDVTLEALRILSVAASSAGLVRALVRMLESPSQEVRLRVADVLATRKEHAAFAPLVRFVERRAHHSLSAREAETYGQGLARLSPSAALSLFKAWAHPPGVLDRLLPKPHERLLRWAAVSGLGELAGDEAADLIRSVRDKADDELRQFCEMVLARRRSDEDRQWMS